MSTGAVVRAGSAEDVLELAVLHVAAFGDIAVDALSRARGSMAEEIARPWARVRVAVVGEAIMGAMVAWVVADEVHVLEVATHPSHRRRGVARLLVLDLLRLAHAERAVQLFLEVRRGNRAAIELYRAAGFSTVGVRARYYADDEDAVEMKLSLDPATGALLPCRDEVAL